MTHRSPLRVRHIDFEFGDDIPFYWNPGHVPWGNMVNMIALAAPGFERYFIRAIRESIPRITDPELAAEAADFCKQEAQHSKHHQSHMRVLTRAHPGLEAVFDEVRVSYEKLYDEAPIEFHLAYSAIVEPLFGPIAKFVVDHRECLFRGAHPTISSFMLWHLLEEFEHRNSAVDIYDHVVGSYAYRMRCAPRVFAHLDAIGKMLTAGFDANVPKSPSGLLPSHVGLFHDEISVLARAALVYDLGCTLLPFHDPDGIVQPAWATQWFAAHDAGVDMRSYYGAETREGAT